MCTGKGQFVALVQGLGSASVTHKVVMAELGGRKRGCWD